MSEPFSSRADAVLASALTLWGRAAGTLAALAPDWQARLKAIPPAAEEPQAGRDRLRDELERELRPDLARVHPSWWVRALQGESSTVRRAVAAFAPLEVRERLRDELQVARDALVPESPPHPVAVSCVLALWSEPFAGGPPPGPDDPIVVRDLATLRQRDLSRRIALAGLLKMAAAPGRPTPHSLPPRIAARLERLRDRFQGADEVIVRAAAWDVRRAGILEMSSLPRLGLTTLARLLAPVGPLRTRWAIQHLPYPTARSLRAAMGANPPGLDPQSLREWEGRLWSWTREAVEAEAEPEADS